MKLSGLVSTGKHSSGSHARWPLLFSLMAVFFCSGLTAQSPASQFPVQQFPLQQLALQQSGAGLSQREALELVRARFPGNVISINEVNQDGRIRFRVRIDNEGNIYTVYVDQATGAVTRE